MEKTKVASIAVSKEKRILFNFSYSLKAAVILFAQSEWNSAVGKVALRIISWKLFKTIFRAVEIDGVRAVF